MIFEVNLSENELKVLRYDIVDIQEWLTNFVKTKIRVIANQIIWEKTDRRPDKMTDEEKLELIKTLNIETAEERNKKFEEEIIKGISTQG